MLRNKKLIAMQKHSILVVDDEEDLCEILQFNLENEGYLVNVAYSGEEVIEKQMHGYDLYILDVMMGDISGYKLAKTIKQNPENRNSAIIFITAKDTENDVLTGFSIGANDYITKPFSIREVIARVKVAIQHRPNMLSKENLIEYKDLSIDIAQKKVYIANKQIDLTRKEFELLAFFLENPNYVFSREILLERIWDNDTFVLDRTVDVNITRLRKKIIPYDKCLITRLGYGYCFETE